MHYGWVGLGGLLGALARYVLGEYVARRAPDSFPLGIFIINVSGAFTLGVLSGLAQETDWISPPVRAAVMVGFLGAYTTFSTWSVDTLRLLESGSYAAAFLNVFGSVGAGLLAAWAGLTLGRLMRQAA